MARAVRRRSRKGATSRRNAHPAQGKKRAKAHISDANRSRRQPRQERAKFTVAAILKAAAEVIDEIGWAHASTNRIAERAGVSIGSLYQYFDSKEAILEKLVEQHHEAVHHVIGSATKRFMSDARVPFDNAIRELFQALIALHREDPVLTRVLAGEVPRHRPREELDIETEQFARLLEQILEQRPDVRLRDTTAAAYLLVTTAEALTRWLAHDAPGFLDTDVLIEEIAVMFSGYVTRRYRSERAT